MCHIDMELCSECSTLSDATFDLCHFGKYGIVCVGPTTDTGSAKLHIAPDASSGVMRADMVYIVKSNVKMVVCSDCESNKVLPEE